MQTNRTGGEVILALAACRPRGICRIVVVTCVQVGILDLKSVIASVFGVARA
jgi:hypothetical protein